MCVHAESASAHKLPIFIDTPAKHDSLNGRLLHIEGQRAAEIAHAAALLQEASLW